MYYKCHKVNFIFGGSYIGSPDWIKKKKTTINNKWFQYAATVALSYEEFKWNPEKAAIIKTFINKYSWKGINCSWKIDDWKTFEKNNRTIAVNILYNKEKEISPAYISKINWNCEKQIILLIIPNKQKKDGIILQ